MMNTSSAMEHNYMVQGKRFYILKKKAVEFIIEPDCTKFVMNKCI